MKRVWIYQSGRKLTETEREKAEKILQDFTSRWASHGRKLNAEAEILYNHFIVLKVDETAFNASGCSIDESVRIIKELEQKFNISLFDRHKMAYLENDEVKLAELNNLSNLYKSGELKENTVVFNNLIDNEDRLNSEWKQAFNESMFFKRFV